MFRFPSNGRLHFATGRKVNSLSKIGFPFKNQALLFLKNTHCYVKVFLPVGDCMSEFSSA